MSITLGFYDFFSYTVPGIFYLFTIDLFFRTFNFPNINIADIGANLVYALVGLLIAYVVGHLMQPIAHGWYRLFNKNNPERKAINEFKENYPELKIAFDIRDRRMLMSFIRHHNLPLAETIDQFNANGIMLENISFGLFLFALVQAVVMLLKGLSSFGVLAVIAALVFSFIAIRKSALFSQWYYSGIFGQALHYGRSVSEMFGVSQQMDGKKVSRK
jgi:hypothetical protein